MSKQPVDKDTHIIRDATQDDASQIARIYNHYVLAGGATFATQPIRIGEIEQMLRTGGSDGWFVAEIVSTQALVGWASARSFSDREGYRRSCETAIYLTPESIGSGIADRLQQTIHEHCVDRGIHHAMAKIVASNDRSLRFHYRHGYSMVGVQNEIGFIDGEWLDVAILQKLFPT